jgi:hypothetical protein
MRPTISCPAIDGNSPPHPVWHMAAEVVDVAVTQTGRLDPHHRAARLRVGHDELTQLPRLVAVEDDRATLLATHATTSSRSALARGTARRNAAS